MKDNQRAKLIISLVSIFKGCFSKRYKIIRLITKHFLQKQMFFLTKNEINSTQFKSVFDIHEILHKASEFECV